MELNKETKTKTKSSNSNITKKDDFSVFADAIVHDLFNKPPIYRRIYESIKATAKRATSRFTRKRR